MTTHDAAPSTALPTVGTPGPAHPAVPDPDLSTRTAARPAAPTRHMIGALTGVRALAGVWVVLDHLQIPVSRLLPALDVLTPPIWSYLCAEMFFILSGFVVAYNYTGKVTTGAGYRRYIWGRLARTYPAYFTTLLMAGILAVQFPATFDAMAGGHFPHTPENLAANLLLMQSLPGFRPINGGSWFIGCVFVAYLLFPLLAWWLRRLSARPALSLAIAVLVAGVYVVMLAAPRATMWVMDPREMWLRIGFEFTAGALLCVWWRSKQRGSAGWDVVAILTVVAVVALSYVLPRTVPQSFVVMPLIALFIVACASATGVVARVLSSSRMQLGGRLAYPLILVHGPVILLVEQIQPWEHLVDAGPAARIGWLVTLLACIAGSTVALHQFVEKPARDRMLAWYAARNPS